MVKSFFNVREENGAGDTGSDSLVNKYKSETPGQGESGEKKQKARKGDMLQNKDEPEKSLKTEEVEEGAKGYKPGWMLKADPKLGAAVKAKQDLNKKRQATYGNPSAGKSVKEEAEQVDEAMKYTDKQIKMAYGIINDPRYKSGNMTAIVKKIEQIAKGLSKHPGVQKAIKVTNEDIEMVIDHLIAEQIEYLDENFEETSMMQNQIEAMEHFLDGIEEFVDNCEDCPEWFQNKLTMAFTQLQSLYSYAHGEMELDDESDDDEEEMEESTKAYGDAMRKKADDRKKASMKPGDMDKLSKLRQMLDKEKK